MPYYTTGFELDPFALPTEEAAKTVIESTVFNVPPECGPCRTELQFSIEASPGKLFTFTLRDKIVPDDHFLLMVKAEAFAIARNEVFRGLPLSREARDFLIKGAVGNVVI